MSSFTTPCRVELIGPNKFRLLEPFLYHIGEYPITDPSRIITVPAGFVTDFATIPRVLWFVLSPIDEYAKAAVIHDWLYNRGYFTRKETDDIFLEAMEVLEVPLAKRRVVYRGVRTGGGWPWARHRRVNGTHQIGEDLSDFFVPEDDPKDRIDFVPEHNEH